MLRRVHKGVRKIEGRALRHLARKHKAAYANDASRYNVGTCVGLKHAD
jgi:hypothetical protein